MSNPLIDDSLLPAEPIPPESYVVRYGVMRQLGEFTARNLGLLRRNSEVIVRTERGTDWGTVLCPASEQTRAWLKSSNEPGRILRLPTPDDDAQRLKIRPLEKVDFEVGRRCIREKNLQMTLIDTERTHAGERVIFYYVAEQRIDFRELVKSLASELKTRIEMRQIGVRDEARLLADYGDCGQPVCCNTFLNEMPPVSMKMAKLQKATLDPNKISGRCGRLKCCLRYEYDTYEDFRKELPAVGSTVVTKQGTGRVIAQEILARKLIVAYDGQRQVMTDMKDIVTVVNSRAPKPTPG